MIAAELILDEIWGGYEKAWPGYASDVYLDANGNELLKWDEASPMPLPEGTAEIQVDTGNKVQGAAA